MNGIKSAGTYSRFLQRESPMLRWVYGDSFSVSHRCYGEYMEILMEWRLRSDNQGAVGPSLGRVAKLSVPGECHTESSTTLVGPKGNQLTVTLLLEHSVICYNLQFWAPITRWALAMVVRYGRIQHGMKIVSI